MGRPRLYTATQLRGRQNAARRIARAERRKGIKSHVVECPPSAAVLAERDRVYAQPLTPNMLCLGDPLPGRRAIDQRGNQPCD